MSPFNGDISLGFGFKEGNRAGLGLLIKGFTWYETVTWKSDVEKGNNQMLTRLTPSVATLVETTS